MPLVCFCRIVVALLLPRFLTALPRLLGSTQIATTSGMWVSSKVIDSLQDHKNRFHCTLVSLSRNTLQVRGIVHDFYFEGLITVKTLSCIARSEHSKMSDSFCTRQCALNFHCRRVPISYHMLQVIQSLKVPNLLSISSFSISRTRFVRNEEGYWIVVYNLISGGHSISRSNGFI